MDYCLILVRLLWKSSKSITFSTMSGTEIMTAAESQVHLGHYYDVDKRPVKGGLLDTRLVPF